MTTTDEILRCSCCGRTYPRGKLHALEDATAYICRRCGLWVALRFRGDLKADEERDFAGPHDH